MSYNMNSMEKFLSDTTFQYALVWGIAALECQSLPTNLDFLYFCCWKLLGVEKTFEIETVQLKQERKGFLAPLNCLNKLGVGSWGNKHFIEVLYYLWKCKTLLIDRLSCEIDKAREANQDD